MRLQPATLGAFGLLGVTAAWGSTFFLLKDVVTRIPVPDFLAVRFAVAAVVLWLLRPLAVAALAPAVRRQGVLLGAVYGVAQILQTAGLEHTSASVSGFITGMYVVFTPLFGAAVLRLRIAPAVWGAVVLATAGLAVLSLRGLAVGYGELLTLASAALYAVHILGTGAVMSRRNRMGDVYGLAVVQMATVALLCTLAAVPGEVTLPTRTGDWIAVAYMAVVAGALALLVQTWAQAHIAAPRAAIIMTMEPVWASFFAVVFGGETLGLRVLVGGSLVLLAMYLSELAAPALPRDSAEVVGRRTTPA